MKDNIPSKERTIGMVAASVAFLGCGSHGEIHLSEITLAEIIDAAIELSRTDQSPVETSGDDLSFTFPKAWAPYLRAVIIGSLNDFEENGDCRWHLNELQKRLEQPPTNQDGQQTPAPSGHAGLGTTGQSPSAVRSSVETKELPETPEQRRARIEANALDDAHRMYEREHGEPFPDSGSK